MDDPLGTASAASYPLTTTLGLDGFWPQMETWGVTDLLPGLYLAILGILAALALKRWYDPIPARVWGVYALLIAVLFGQSLLGGSTLFPGDTLRSAPPYDVLPPPAVPGNHQQLDLVLFVTPLQALVREHLFSGHWPLWNPSAALGMPLLADPQSQALQTITVPGYLLSLDDALTFTAALSVLIALAFTFLYLRREGVGETAALAGGTIHGLGAFLQLWLGWTPATVACMLPLVLYAVALCRDRAGKRDLGLLAFGTMTIALAGHPETALYALITLGLFTIVVALRQRERRLATLLRCSGAIVLGVSVAAPSLLPAAEYTPGTTRYAEMQLRRDFLEKQDILEGWRSAEERAERWEDIVERLVPIVAPNAFGNDRFGAYWGRRSTYLDAAGFAGTVAGLATLLALFPGRRRFRGTHETFMKVLAAACVIVVVRPPILAHILDTAPIVGHSSSQHHRILMLLNLCMAYLTACTIERWQRGGLKRARVAITALILGGLLAWAYLAHPDPANAATLTLLRHFSLALHLTALAAAALMFALRGAAPARVPARSALIAIVAVELVGLHGSIHPPMPARLSYPELPAIRFMRERVGSQRVMGYGRCFLPSAAAVYGLNDTRVYNPMEPVHYTLLVRRLTPGVNDLLRQFTVPDHALYDLMGVKYVIAPRATSLPEPLELVYEDDSARVYERFHPLPLLFLPESALVHRAGDWSQWLFNNADFRKLALIQSDSGEAGWQASLPDQSTLELEVVESAYLRCRASLCEKRLLATGVYQDGGWRLLVDNVYRDSTWANGPLLAAWLSAGDSLVEWVYRPPGLVSGIMLAALALAIAMTWWGLPSPLPGGGGFTRRRFLFGIVAATLLAGGLLLSMVTDRLAVILWVVVQGAALLWVARRAMLLPCKRYAGLLAIVLGLGLAMLALFAALDGTAFARGLAAVARGSPSAALLQPSAVAAAGGVILALGISLSRAGRGKADMDSASRQVPS
ncbi:MAG: hypothetical protein AB1486_05035 [Planctomycetota bacterium]